MKYISTAKCSFYLAQGVQQQKKTITKITKSPNNKRKQNGQQKLGKTQTQKRIKPPIIITKNINELMCLWSPI